MSRKLQGRRHSIFHFPRRDVNPIIYTVDVIKAAGDTFLTPFFAFTVCLWGEWLCFSRLRPVPLHAKAITDGVHRPASAGSLSAKQRPESARESRFSQRCSPGTVASNLARQAGCLLNAVADIPLRKSRHENKSHSEVVVPVAACFRVTKNC